MIIATYTLAALLGTALVWKGASWLETASERLSVYYALPDIVAGAIVVAVGSSFPELTAAVLSPLLHGDFELGVAAIVGSAIFNILVIPALSVLRAPGALQANRDLVYKEAQFYMLAICILLLTFSFGAIYHPVEAKDAILGRVDGVLALMPLGMYGLYVFVQWQDTMEFEPESSTEAISVRREWLRLLGALLLIVIGVEGLVRAAIFYGDFFGTPSFLSISGL